MKLYLYDHCPFCVRARMIFGLKNLPVENIYLLDNDVETPTKMIGRKMLPILEKDNGEYLPESLDIVHYVDQLSAPAIATGEISPEVDQWFKEVSGAVYKLVVPRFTQSSFPEIKTPEAKKAYIEREEKRFGDLNIPLKETKTFLIELEPHMDVLDEWLEKRGDIINIDDFIIFPVLRSLSIVADLPFSTTILNYMEKMSKAANVELLFDQAK
ncbi:glutaredoxin 2 [Providencia sneebia]|uniref:Glutaredoxin 2 n=1 Tax=Providencia sneebia DSM 19967 TaxID=1141660 RepID=K8WCB2_9GAMM|nr:glutaredoxin 2 [Providencia sneebia]EKT57531.1 glutaredoxin 2 [Providencia sneebia DSM 19967]